MAESPDRSPETSREEDYRDYDERDLEEGWPYPDADAAGAKRNEAYGAAPAGLGANDNPGAGIAGNPAIPSEGGPTLARGTAREAIDDDALEERIFDQLVGHEDIDEDEVTVTVHHGIAELSGHVDRLEATFIAERIAGSVPGVRLVRNTLVATGTDSHVPGDADD